MLVLWISKIDIEYLLLLWQLSELCLFRFGKRGKRRKLSWNIKIIGRLFYLAHFEPTVFLIIRRMRWMVWGHCNLKGNLSIHFITHFFPIRLYLQVGPFVHLSHVVVITEFLDRLFVSFKLFICHFELLLFLLSFIQLFFLLLFFLFKKCKQSILCFGSFTTWWMAERSKGGRTAPTLHTTKGYQVILYFWSHIKIRNVGIVKGNVSIWHAYITIVLKIIHLQRRSWRLCTVMFI